MKFQKSLFFFSAFRNRTFVLSFSAAMLFAIIFSSQSHAIKLKDFLKTTAKVALTGFAVDKLAGPLNDFINTLLMNNGAANRDATKVVPIITAGRKGHVGACQVTGDAEQLKTVRAVIMIESDYQTKIRVKAMIPSNSVNPLKFNRVHGVGVSAIIDIPM
ncbi:MAG: hypothetical protein CVV64_11270 [Candidatus Wallbacteria bacterium HGW-Wallbacteria-1]|uniref:Uncharacterized protein n=1 Tax=Candidatus Wallbacteria bacterium HGW-Wallbacteria-1 TaxID=2013854 RepID=A0A2N1PP20_9BACT|nr:MAG: hypothetical protein CVV64_11270 [Candidatus Wallbacteria bacterium HGW-Wallbacteria-1]